MSDIENGGSMATSEAFKALSDQLQQAGGSAESLETILWMIGGHPELLGHGRVFRQLNELLRSNVFSADSLYWASAWRHDVPAWIDALTRIESLAHLLREIPVLQPMCKEPRHERDHLLLRHGVTRHPIPAALFNQYQAGAAQSPGGAEARYQTMRAHVVAMYFESRWRAAQGRDEFMRHTGNKEFARVPVGAGPVGLCLREFSLLGYMPLLLQFTASTASYNSMDESRVAPGQSPSSSSSVASSSPAVGSETRVTGGASSAQSRSSCLWMVPPVHPTQPGCSG